MARRLWTAVAGRGVSMATVGCAGAVAGLAAVALRIAHEATLQVGAPRLAIPLALAVWGVAVLLGKPISRWMAWLAAALIQRFQTGRDTPAALHAAVALLVCAAVHGVLIAVVEAAEDGRAVVTTRLVLPVQVAAVLVAMPPLAALFAAGLTARGVLDLVDRWRESSDLDRRLGRGVAIATAVAALALGIAIGSVRLLSAVAIAGPCIAAWLASVGRATPSSRAATSSAPSRRLKLALLSAGVVVAALGRCAPRVPTELGDWAPRPLASQNNASADFGSEQELLAGGMQTEVVPGSQLWSVDLAGPRLDVLFVRPSDSTPLPERGSALERLLAARIARSLVPGGRVVVQGAADEAWFRRLARMLGGEPLVVVGRLPEGEPFKFTVVGRDAREWVQTRLSTATLDLQPLDPRP